MADAHDLLVRRADSVRSRLVETLEALDARRRILTDPKEQARRHPAVLVGMGTVLVVAIGGSLLISSWQTARLRRHLREERWQALRRFWFHPDRLARARQKPSLARRIVGGAIVSTMSYLAGVVTKRFGRRLVRSSARGASAVVIAPAE
jgi:hypothetical protein